VTARAELDSVFVTITARDPSPAHAAAVADGIAREVVALSPLVPVEGSAAATSRLVSIAESAVVPEAPESPRVVLNGLVGAVSGLALALLAVFVREATARVVRAYTPVGSRLGLPILGRLPRDPTKATALPGGTPTGSVDVDVLRRRLDFLALGTDDRVFMVVSPLAGEGRTTVAVALAQCMADSGRRTLLIDADLLRPAVHVRYGLPNLAGLMTGLRASDPREATPTQEVGQRLHVIVAGTPGHTGPMPLVHARIAALTAMVRERYDAVVVDTPAMHESKVATELAPHVDRAILVARVDYSDRPALTEAVRLLSEAGRELTGVVLNDVPTDRLRSALDRLRRPPGSPPAQAARLGR
jgi:Mrp family chromosome partitioning ATPase